MILANGCNITKSDKFKGVWILSVPTVYTYRISSTYEMQTWSSGNVVLSHVYIHTHTHTQTHTHTHRHKRGIIGQGLIMIKVSCAHLPKSNQGESCDCTGTVTVCVCVCVCVCVYMLARQLEPYESLPHPLCSSQRWINHVQRCQHLPKQFYMGINGRWGCCSLFNQFHQMRFYLV